jgi:hypothetical protein
MRFFRSALVGLVSLGMFLVAIREAYNIRLYAITVRRGAARHTVPALALPQRSPPPPPTPPSPPLPDLRQDHPRV